MRKSEGLEELEDGRVRYAGGATILDEKGDPLPYLVARNGGAYCQGQILANPYGLDRREFRVISLGVGKPLCVERVL